MPEQFDYSIVFSTNSARTIGYPHAKKINLNPYLIPYIEINSKWIIDFHVKGKN